MTKYEIQRIAQPTGNSCGPTCLCMIFDFYGHKVKPDDLIKETEMIDVGTYDGHMGAVAIKHGFSAEINTLDLYTLDPTRFKLRNADIIKKMEGSN